MQWFIAALKKYAVFSGRARRMEYWMYALFYFIIAIVLAVVDSMISSGGVGFLGAIFGLAMLLPSLGVSIRRLHDINKSGWWILIAFIPLIGALILLYFMVKAGDTGDNEYGPDPIAAAA